MDGIELKARLRQVGEDYDGYSGRAKRRVFASIVKDEMRTWMIENDIVGAIEVVIGQLAPYVESVCVWNNSHTTGTPRGMLNYLKVSDIRQEPILWPSDRRDSGWVCEFGQAARTDPSFVGESKMWSFLGRVLNITEEVNGAYWPSRK